MNYNKNRELGEIIEIKTHGAMNYSGYTTVDSSGELPLWETLWRY